MSIPKIIHYCWFGGNELSPLAKKCIESWKKYCPDYKIIKWDESNFDITQNSFMCEAYEAKKWAFATDVARLIVVYEYGGIYFDTDVELLKPLDELTEYSGFMAFEGKQINTGLGFGAEVHNPIIKELLDGYQNLQLWDSNGKLGQHVSCPEVNTAQLCKRGLRADGTYQVIDDVHFFPSEFFCPMDWRTHELTNLTSNTISIHHYEATWWPWTQRLLSRKMPKNPIMKIVYVVLKIDRRIKRKFKIRKK